MDDTNEKKLSRILLIIIGIVLLIVFAILGKYMFTTDKYGYTLPKSAIKKMTTKVRDNSYHILSNDEKVRYNEKLKNDTFLIPLNNAIIGMQEVYNVNLLQSDISKIKYAYTKILMNDGTLDVTPEMLKAEINNNFVYGIEDNNLNDYFANNNKYNYNSNYSFCLKATESKEENNMLYLKFDYLSYDEELCSNTVLEYKTDKEGLIVFNKNSDKYYINSYTLMKKEG